MQNVAFVSFDLDEKLLKKLDVQLAKYEKTEKKDSVSVHCNPENNLPYNCMSDSHETYRHNLKTEKFNKNIIESQQQDIINNKYQQDAFFTCLSPILKPLLETKKTGFISFSTPLNKKVLGSESEKFKEKQDTINYFSASKDNMEFKNYDFIDLDLFEDWNDSDILAKREEESNSLITISQAVELVEKTGKAMQNKVSKKTKNYTNNLNNSPNLETKEIIKNSNQEISDNLFADSFDWENIEFSEKKNCFKFSAKKEDNNTGENNIFVQTQSIILDFGDNFKNFSEKICNGIEITKPKAAHKLNFEDFKNESFEIQDLNFEKNELDIKTNIQTFSESSFLNEMKENETTSLLKSEEKIKKLQLFEKNEELSNLDKLAEYTDDSLHLLKKKRKLFKIEESDIDELDELNTNTTSLQKKTYKKKSLEKQNLNTDLIDEEAEVSKNYDGSSDEDLDTEEENYEKSFVNDNSFSQSDSIEMTAKYLESIKFINNRPGTFKIPKQVPYFVEDVFSQVLSETNLDYEIDSFCVNDIEYEDQEPSNLEIAEQILETRRKKKKRIKK